MNLWNSNNNKSDPMENNLIQQLANDVKKLENASVKKEEINPFASLKLESSGANQVNENK